MSLLWLIKCFTISQNNPHFELINLTEREIPGMEPRPKIP
jgi:hypothetical protein